MRVNKVRARQSKMRLEARVEPVGPQKRRIMKALQIESEFIVSNREPLSDDRMMDSLNPIEDHLKSYSDHSQTMRRAMLMRLKKWLASTNQPVSLQGLTEDVGKAYLDWVVEEAKPRELQDSYKRQIIQVLRAFSKYLLRKMITKTDVFAGLKRPPPGKPKPNPLSPEFAAKLIRIGASAKFKKRHGKRRAAMFRLAMSIASDTGTRPGETPVLRLKDFSLEAGGPTVQIYSPKTNTSDVAPLSMRTYRRLLAWKCQIHSAKGWIFPMKKGDVPYSPRFFKRMLDFAWADLIELVPKLKPCKPPTMKSCRSGLATLVARLTGDPYMVKRAIRVRSVHTTMHYVEEFGTNELRNELTRGHSNFR